MRRSPYLVNDTLLQIQNASANNTLKRPLKVQFIGEQGVDEGGVQKVLAAAMPNYIAFPGNAPQQLAALRLDHLAASAPALRLTVADDFTTCAYLQKGPIVPPHMWLNLVGRSIADLTGPAFGMPALFLQHHSQCQ